MLELLASEVATNAVLHAETPFTVTVIVGEVVRVEVTDANPAPPVQRRHEPLAVTGRGLEIVDRAADRWGCRIDGVGKTVWFELRADRRAVSN